MGVENENFITGGTGAALFTEGLGQSHRPRNNQQNLGDEYVPPVGLPEWKQPSFDDDDHVRPDPVISQGIGSKFIFIKNELAVAKVFYFFFFGAFGSLFPMLGIYFKNLGMDAAQVGFLVGIRPIVEYLATPFWHGMSDRFQAGKLLLLMSVAGWVVFTLPIGYIHPPVVSCKLKNGSHYMLIQPSYMERNKREAPIFSNKFDTSFEDLDQVAITREKRESFEHAKWAPGYVVGTSPQVIHFDDYSKNYEKGKEWVSPSYSNEVFERSGVEKVFFLVLLLVIIGEFFASPAAALADSAVISSLGDEQDKYGSQRMFGSLGWGVTMFIMGIVLDNSTIFPSAICKMNARERNYNVCFYMFSLMMLLAFLVSTQFTFRYSLIKQDDMAMNNMKITNADTRRVPDKTSEEKLKEQAKKIKYFAKELQGMPEFAAVFKTFSNVRLLMFMLVAWVMGVGVGLIFTFLFWHLQDYGGHPTIFGIASVINHVSEMGAYMYSFKIISQYGHVKVLIAGLACNVVRFLYVSVITNSWLVLPIEVLQGITHAAVWAACCSFISHNTEEALRPSAQGVLKGVYHGFGQFCGSVFGGMLVKTYGSTLIFRIYGLMCGIMLIIFTIFNFYNISEGKFSTEIHDEVDPANVVKGEYMAPHGVPLTEYKPKPRSRRNSDEEQMAAENAEAAQSNPFLDPNTTNQQYYGASGAVAGAVDDQNYYGRGYSQAQSGYSSSGFGY